MAGGGVHPLANGMATAADWMSAASFISMAGIIAFMGYDGTVYLMGWTGGYVLLALLLAPYLRKFGEFTVPDFIGARYYSNTARVVAVICLVVISFTYVAGQMRGVGIVFSQFLNVPILWGVVIGMAVVFFYAVLGGMKGITYTQVAQYCVLIFAYLVPAIFISLLITGIPVPQLGLGAEVADGSGLTVLEKLDRTLVELGFGPYTDGSRGMIDVLAITLALMIGTAGLPHVIVRFFTVPKVSDARLSAGYALLFIALLYTTAPAVGAFARLNFVDTVHETPYADVANWFKRWEDIGLIGWVDKNGDGAIQYAPGAAFAGAPEFTGDRGDAGERRLANEATASANEVYVDRDIMVLANPEIAALPGWVIALVAAGGLAAALSTAAGLLLVISALGFPRPHQEDTGPGHQRPPGTAVRTHLRGDRHSHRRLSRHQSARIRCPGGGVRVRPGRRIAVPRHSARHLSQGNHQGRRHRRHAHGPDVHLRLHRLLQVRLSGTEYGRALVVRHLPGRHRRGGRRPEFRHRHRCQPLAPAVPASVQSLVESIRVPAGVERPHDH